MSQSAHPDVLSVSSSVRQWCLLTGLWVQKDHRRNLFWCLLPRKASNPPNSHHRLLPDPVGNIPKRGCPSWVVRHPDWSPLYYQGASSVQTNIWTILRSEAALLCCHGRKSSTSDWCSREWRKTIGWDIPNTCISCLLSSKGARVFDHLNQEATNGRKFQSHWWASIIQNAFLSIMIFAAAISLLRMLTSPPIDSPIHYYVWFHGNAIQLPRP
jgi:hypothetical protein